ncbi:hypothetical protein [Georgenia alba]|uniref:BFD-like [2Fe-2S]-binding domain-containing protein n=1 Tax=Georgenia alba TaxID=2233858 RepID=A0ABW2QCR0_9MICO
MVPDPTGASGAEALEDHFESSAGGATRAGTGCGSCHETIRERLAAWAASIDTTEALRPDGVA